MLPLLRNQVAPVRVCDICRNVLILRTRDERLRSLPRATRRNIEAAQKVLGAKWESVEKVETKRPAVEISASRASESHHQPTTQANTTAAAATTNIPLRGTARFFFPEDPSPTPQRLLWDKYFLLPRGDGRLAIEVTSAGTRYGAFVEKDLLRAASESSGTIEAPLFRRHENGSAAHSEGGSGNVLIKIRRTVSLGQATNPSTSGAEMWREMQKSTKLLWVTSRILNTIAFFLFVAWLPSFLDIPLTSDFHMIAAYTVGELSFVWKVLVVLVLLFAANTTSSLSRKSPAATMNMDRESGENRRDEKSSFEFKVSGFTFTRSMAVDDSVSSTTSSASAQAANAPPSYIPAQVPPGKESAIEELVSKFLSTAASDSWKSASVQNEVHLSTKSGKLASAKGVGVIPFPVRAVNDVLWKSFGTHNEDGTANPLCKKLDPDKVKSEVIEQLDEHTAIEWQSFRSVAFISGRDFCNLTHWRVLKNGAVLIIGCPTEHHACPAKRGLVRGRCELGGWLLEPIGTNKDQTRVSYIVVLDLKGSIPKWVLKMVITSQPLAVARLRTLVDEEAKRHGKNYVDHILSLGPLQNKPRELIGERAPDVEPSLIAQKTHEPPASQQVSSRLHGYEDLLEQKAKELQSYGPDSDESKWESLGREEGVEISRFRDSGDLVIMRGIVSLPYPLRTVFHLVIASGACGDARNYRRSPSLRSKRDIKVIDEQTSIQLSEYKGIAFVKGRDFLNLLHWRVLPDGRILSFGTGITDDTICPPSPRYVRGHVVIGGFIYEPAANGTATRLTYIASIDLKGSIPGWVVRMKAKEQPMQLKIIRDLLDEEADLHGGRDAYIRESLKKGSISNADSNMTCS